MSTPLRGFFLAGLTIMMLVATTTTVLAGPTVLFDQGHGERFLVERSGDLDLSLLAKAFQSAGCDVVSSRAPINSQSLKGVSALVISGPFVPLAPDEIDAVMGFLDRGGRMALMLHVAPPMAGLLARLKLDYSNGVVRDEEHKIKDQPLDFYVTRLEGHPLFQGVNRFAVLGSWALINTGKEARIIAWSGPSAWVDLNRSTRLDGGDAVQAFGLVATGKVGAGEFVVFADDAVFQNRYLTEFNRPIGDRLVHWLSRGKTR